MYPLSRSMPSNDIYAVKPCWENTNGTEQKNGTFFDQGTCCWYGIQHVKLNYQVNALAAGLGGHGVTKRGEWVSNTARRRRHPPPPQSHRAVPGVDGRRGIDKVNGCIQVSSHDSPVQSRVAIRLDVEGKQSVKRDMETMG